MLCCAALQGLSSAPAPHLHAVPAAACCSQHRSGEGVERAGRVGVGGGSCLCHPRVRFGSLADKGSDRQAAEAGVLGGQVQESEGGAEKVSEGRALLGELHSVSRAGRPSHAQFPHMVIVWCSCGAAQSAVYGPGAAGRHTPGCSAPHCPAGVLTCTAPISARLLCLLPPVSP